MKLKKPVMVIGVGNLIQMDDGVGIHTINQLKEFEIPENVELFDGGTLGIDLMPYIEGREKLIIIDSVKGNEKPGTIYRFSPDDLTYDTAPKTSVHQIGLIDSLQMASLMGKAPSKITIYGIQPGIIDWGEELTLEVAAAVPRIVNLVLDEIEKSVMEIKKENIKENILEGNNG